MDKIKEEVPVTNISSGDIANPENRPLDISAKKQNKKSPRITSMFKRWKDKVDNV